MHYDAIVLGDGIAGFGAALGLARHGKKVLIAGKGGEGASTPRAAGILDPFLEMRPGSPLFRLAREAFRCYPSWVRSLGVSLEEAGYKNMGMIYAAMSARELKELRRRYAWQKDSGIPVQWLEPEALLKKEPAFSKDVLGGLFYPSIPRVQPEKLMKALRGRARKKGVRSLRAHTDPELVVSKDRILGIRIGKHFFQSDIVVEASGAWAGLEKNRALRLPVRPVRGQILIVKNKVRKISAILHSLDGGYVVPWDASTLLLGSTVEQAGFHPVTTSKGLASIRRRIEKIVPALKNAKILDSWAGLRPFPKDRLPVLGKGPLQGLYFAAGYYRSGILISGLAGELLAKGIVTGRMPAILRPFSAGRFK